MNAIKKMLCVLLTLCTSISVLSQNASIKKLDMKDGLSNNYVVGITQDQQGCLWFATESGLNRFDGNQFSVYTKYHSGLAANELNQVMADKNRPIIWIATQRDGLCEYNYQTNTFTTYTCNTIGDNRIVTNDVTDLNHAVDGGIWINTYHWGVDHFDYENKTFTHYNKENVKNLVSQKTWTSADDGKGNLYIGHPFDGMSIISLKDRTARNYKYESGNSKSIPGNDVRSICIDHTGNIWVGTTNGLALFNPQTEEFITIKHIEGQPQSLLSNEVYSIKQLNDGKLWIGTYLGGVSIFDPSQDLSVSANNITFKNILPADDESGLSGNNVRCVFEDSYGNIWIGDYGNGISCIPHIQPPFNVWKHRPNVICDNNLFHSRVWGLCMDSEQQLWIGMEGAIDLFENQKHIKRFLSKEYNTNHRLPLAAIFEDSKNNIWLGIYQGDVRIYNRKTKKFKTLKLDKEVENDVRCFYESPDGNVWIGTQNGLYRYSPLEDSVSREVDMNEQLPDHMIRSILQDKDGNLWVATFGKGICVFNRKKELISNFVTANGFCSNAVNHLYRDSQQRIWAGTREGLVCFSNTRSLEQYTVFKEAQGLDYCYIHAIIEDRDGNIWISANGGISCYNEREKRFYNYNHTDRTPMGDFMDGSVAKGVDGTLYFGSQYGVCNFHPQEVMGKQRLAKIAITDFVIYHSQTEDKGNESRPVINNKVEIPFNQNTFSITFNVPDYAQSSRVEYAYMLEGLEKSWYDSNGENQITFRNIPYGTYTFRVKARIRNQEYDPEQSMFTIQINPPLWLAWWAKIIYILIFATIIWCIAYFYKRKLSLENSLQLEKTSHLQEQELNNERLRFYTNITHELRTPLTLILGPLEDMMGDQKLPEKYGRKISLIHQSATLLLNLINQILEFRKTETQNKKLCVSRGDIARLVRGIGISYTELNKNPKVKISVNIETEQIVLFFDADIVTIILNNLLSNAVKYTEEGCITITLRSVYENDMDYTEIEISDTGYGIPAESLEHIFDRYYQVGGEHSASGTGIGLALVKSLVMVHQGEIKVESEVNKGTTFRIRLLTANTYPNALHADFESTEGYKKQFEAENQEEDEQKEGKPIVLVVEDNTNIQQYIVDSFSEFYEVITATNGKEGLEMAFNRIPNIVISDIMMPVMDGIEMCKKLKEDVRTSHVPLIMLTAKDSLSDKEEGYSVGADSYLTKPFSANLLHSRVDNLLKSRKELAVKLLSTGKAGKSASISNNTLSKLDKEFIDKITKIIEDNMQSDKMDVAFIAEKMFMSHSTLYRKIKGLTDMSANEFVRKVKMRYAERMLSTGEYTTTEIAYMVGINSVTYFRQCFKDEFGVSPSEYLKGGAR